MTRLHAFALSAPKKALLVAAVAITLAACESGSGGPGIGTVAGAAAGAGAGRAIFGGSTSAMLIGGAVGGLAGNMTVDRANEDRQFQRGEASQDAAMQRQLDFERQRALQQEDLRRQQEERRLFEEWQRQQRN
ncbi:MAG TPA: glycine zipper domain-containing protein [Rhodospirillales bacterium]|nr:glycine zipper domain-containing protein [Rhodospirillales bacterium]